MTIFVTARTALLSCDNAVAASHANCTQPHKIFIKHSAVALFCFAIIGITAGSLAHADDDPTGLAMKGVRLTPAEADLLEKRLSRDETDLDARIQLLGFYQMSRRGQSDAAQRKGMHVVWMIENAPENPVFSTGFATLNHVLQPAGYRDAKEAWLKQLKSSPDNPAVLFNASQFFDLCAVFWKSPRSDLKKWIDDVKADRIPKFGGNLAY